MLAYKFRLYPNKEEERKLLWTKELVRSERPKLKLVDRRPILHQEMKQAVWMKQEAPLERTG